LALPRFAIAWSTNSATSLIQEWAPASPDKVLILAGVSLIALLLVAGELRGARLTWSQRLLAILLFAATMLHIRNLALFAIVAGPGVAGALDVLLPAHNSPDRRTWRRDGGLAALAVAAALGLIILHARGPLDAGGVGPAVADLTALHTPLRVACEDFSWCSRFAGDTRVQVLLDGRTDAYPATVFADYRRMGRGDPLPVFARWRINAALVHANGAAARVLRARGWKRLRSAEPQVYLRPGV
jgi:hypothetical protein